MTFLAPIASPKNIAGSDTTKMKSLMVSYEVTGNEGGLMHSLVLF